MVTVSASGPRKTLQLYLTLCGPETFTASELHGERPACCPGFCPRLTYKSQSHTIYIFSRWECESTPVLHSLLLLLAGDVEQNPGPTYPCPVCGRKFAKSRGASRCSGCVHWLCFTNTCSAWSHTRRYYHTWLAVSQLPAFYPHRYK